MAFNPFHTFRKHQKVIFAILTIICMIVFILQFGSGDVFSRFGIGHGGQGKGEKVVALYGRDVYSGDIEHTLQSRKLANELVLQALSTGEKTASKELNDYKPEKPDPTELELTFIRDKWRERNFQVEILQAEMARGMISPEQAAQQMRTQLDQGVPEVRQAYSSLLRLAKESAASADADKDKTAQQAKIIADLRLVLKTQLYQLTRSDSPFYFGGGVKPDDILDFEIWKHQADKLGVVLTKADARRALAHAAADHDLPTDPGASWSADPALKDFFTQNKQVLEDHDLVPAVVDEFRVLIAQDLLAGRTTGVQSLDDINRIVPDPAAPYDFWKFYRDDRTTLKVAFLPIPVESFVDKVDRKPTTQELREFFEDHKSQEPDPNSAVPGFKEPRRIKVEYVTVKTDTPYYQARTQATTLDPTLFYLTAGVAEHLAGAGVVPATALYAYLNKDPLQSAYDFDYVEENRFALTSAAGLFGLGCNPAPAFAVPPVFHYVAEEKENKARLRLASASFLSALDGATGGTMFPGISLPTASIPTTLPPNEAMRQLAEKRQKDAASRVIEDDVTAFAKELDKLRAKPEEARAAIQKTAKGLSRNNLNAVGVMLLQNTPLAVAVGSSYFLTVPKERGWEIQESAALDDRYQVETDETLKALKEALQPLLRDPHDPRKELGFGDFLFKMMKPGVYELHGPIPAGTDKKIAFWRSEDNHAQELSFDEARPRVEAAWTFQQARILALQAANKIENGVRAEAPVEAIRSLKDAGKFLKDTQGEGAKLGADFELGDVARLIRGPLLFSGVSQYQPYTIPAGLIPQARPDLLDLLLTLDKPGKTLVFRDQPATHFYVAVLDERDDVQFNDQKKDKKFLEAYEEASPQVGKFQEEQLWRRYFLSERQAKFHDALMRQLREEAAAPATLDEKGRLILSGKASQQPQPDQPINPPDTSGGSDFGL
jgi:hypothetical protein